MSRTFREETTGFVKLTERTEPSVGAAEIEPQVEAVLGSAVVRWDIVIGDSDLEIVAIRCGGLHPSALMALGLGDRSGTAATVPRRRAIFPFRLEGNRSALRIDLISPIVRNPAPCATIMDAIARSAFCWSGVAVIR